MAISPPSCCRNDMRSVSFLSGGRHLLSCGLTLIEVLVALAIVGIAMMAVVKATSQHIRATTYLQNKMIATWVGEQVINEARAGLLKIEGQSENLRLTTDMLGQEWFWKMAQVETPNPRIKKIIVTVFSDEQEEEDGTPLSTLEGYVDDETKT